MSRIFQSSVVAVALVAGWVSPAQAAAVKEPSVAEQLAAMQAQLSQLNQRVDSLEGRVAQEKARADAAVAKLAQAQADASAARAEVAKLAAVAPTATAKPATEITWDGAPKLATKDGWSFKPRGRIDIAAGSVSTPAGITDRGLGFASEMRRARLGAEGTIPGGFGYKFEMDFATGSVEITDAVITYKDGDLGLSIGQHNNFQSLEELTSSRFSSFVERAAFTDAFGFERRLGLSASYQSGAMLLQGGFFTDNIDDLSNDENNSVGADLRAVYAPKLGKTQLHVGGSLHWRDLNDAATSLRYRQRPFTHTSDTRFIDTGSFSARNETGYGLELAAINGPFHFAGEAYWQKVGRAGLADPTFFGGSFELGYFMTKGDTRGYKGGQFDRVKPSNPVGKGGSGAIQVNLRYDYLDLVDAGITGGTQNGYQASLVWTPISYLRFMANYGRIEYDRAAIAAAGGSRSYSVDVAAMRAIFDF